MENRLILVDPADDLIQRATLPVNTALELQISSQRELEVAGDIVRTLKDLQDEINQTFEPIVKQAHLAHKAAKKAQNDHLAPLQEAEATLRVKMNSYMRKVELDRLVATAARQKAEDNLKQQPAAQRPMFAAPSRESMGAEIGIDAKKFDAIRIAPPKLPEVPVPTKVEGIHTVEDWKWKVVDVSAIPAEFWILDEMRIDNHVKFNKGGTQIPGIEVWSESRAVVRR